MDAILNNVIEQAYASSSAKTEALKVLYHSEDKLYFQINNPTYSEMNVSLFNSAGNVLINKNILVESGVSTHEINIEKMPSGIYLLQLMRDKEVFSQRAQIVR
mgnify:CR=1 FL=1